ncbi:hypothetical protein ABZP36_017289 [Zizania latifolia]
MGPVPGTPPRDVGKGQDDTGGARRGDEMERRIGTCRCRLSRAFGWLGSLFSCSKGEVDRWKSGVPRPEEINGDDFGMDFNMWGALPLLYLSSGLVLDSWHGLNSFFFIKKITLSVI